MTKEEMFKEMEKMAPVLERNGVDIVLGKRILCPSRFRGQ